MLALKGNQSLMVNTNQIGWIEFTHLLIVYSYEFYV